MHLKVLKKLASRLVLGCDHAKTSSDSAETSSSGEHFTRSCDTQPSSATLNMLVDIFVSTKGILVAEPSQDRKNMRPTMVDAQTDKTKQASVDGVQ